MAHAAAGGAVAARGRVTGGLPVGRLVATGGAPDRIEPGVLTQRLTVEGLPLVDLAVGTSLRIGDAVVVERTAGDGDRHASGGGLVEAETGAGVPARVLVGGSIRPGDAVVVEAVTLPLEDSLDLHPFRPEDVTAVVAEYLTRAAAAGLAEVRIIHGRGRGVQRQTVRRLLAVSPVVSAFGDAPPERGGWGATVVQLRRTPEG